jgi:predicted molibdopterin-dependent oxidoreductase YjgC
MDYPIMLTTERDLYTAGVLSEKVEGLRGLRTKNHVHINPRDADDFDISDGETIRIISRHGSIESDARLTSSTPSGLAVMNLEKEKINKLLNPVLDEISKTPEMKICAIRLEKIRRSGKLRKKRVVEVSASGVST